MSEITIDLGCGTAVYPGAVGLDIRALPIPLYIRGDIRHLPLRDKSVHALVSRHTLEHLIRDDAERFLRDCLRVLRPSGTLRLTCPDLVACCQTLIRADDGSDSGLVTAITHNIYGGQTYGENHHYWGWTISSLMATLRQVGFADVQTLPPTDCHELHLLATTPV